MSTSALASHSGPAPHTPLRTLLRLLPLLLIACALVAMLAEPLTARAAGPRVDVGQINGTITPVMARYVQRTIQHAEQDGATAVVFEMDTPGGLSTAMDDIIRDILQSKVPVVVYVSPRGARAASAGVYITYAAHVAAMAPGTNIGSASPVFMDTSGNETDGSATMKAKVTNDAVSQITNLAALRGRNAAWAEQAVRNAVNITADEAVKEHVVDLSAPDLPTLLAQIDGRTVAMASGTAVLHTKGAVTHDAGMGWMDEFLQLVADPTVAYILLSLGMLGLVMELAHPGAFLPGVIGVLFLLLALFSLGTLPVNWAGVLLILFAFVLFAVDLFVHSFGSLTVGGVVSFVIGSYLLVGSNAPPGFQIARPVIWTMTACLVAFFVFLAGAVMRARLRPPFSGRQALIGEVGTVRTALDPQGMVYLRGELWQAESARGETIPVGAAVNVTAVDGLTLFVVPWAMPEAPAAPAAPVDDRRVVPAGGVPRRAKVVAAMRDVAERL